MIAPSRALKLAAAPCYQTKISSSKYVAAEIGAAHVKAKVLRASRTRPLPSVHHRNA